MVFPTIRQTPGENISVSHGYAAPAPALNMDNAPTTYMTPNCLSALAAAAETSNRHVSNTSVWSAGISNV